MYVDQLLVWQHKRFKTQCLESTEEVREQHIIQPNAHISSHYSKVITTDHDYVIY